MPKKHQVVITMRSENPTVYSTELGRICPDCGKPVDHCVCKKARVPAGDGKVRVRCESKGRKGKTVTLVTGIPLTGEPLRSLLGDLKRLCGSGGTLKEGVIEIQGDHRAAIAVALKQRGFPTKFAGG
jgi:translation initiation factor 1